MRFALVALSVLPVALGAISITAPSSSQYWVQNTSNTITWTYSAGDPNPINIVVYNSDAATLNGNFSIAQHVDVSNQSYTVTNVTLVTGSGYVVQFVNPSNGSVVYAVSQPFSVDASGTTPAPTSSASSAAPSSTAPGSGSASGSAGSSTSASSASSSGTTHSSAASPQFRVDSFGSIVSVIAACGIAAFSALLL